MRNVASIAVFRDGKLLWLRRRDNGKWTLPGGHCHHKEEPLDAAARELSEETSLDPNGGQITYLGDDVVPNKPLRIFSFAVELPAGDVDLSKDPDGEATEYQWLEEPPDNDEAHVPHEHNVTLKMLGLEPKLAKGEKDRQKHWRASDGMKIPHRTNPDRKVWDKAYKTKLIEHFADGDHKRLVPVEVPVDESYFGHHVGGAVGPGGRDRRTFYLRMLRGGETLPPPVVTRSGTGWTFVDGNARLWASLKHGLKTIQAYELKPAKVRKAEARDPIAHILQFGKQDQQRIAAKSPDATAEHISMALEHKDPTVREAAIQNPNATSDHIFQALKDPSYYVKWHATRHPNASPAHINEALKDSDPAIRLEAIKHPNASLNNITVALKDEDESVVEEAKKTLDRPPPSQKQIATQKSRFLEEIRNKNQARKKRMQDIATNSKGSAWKDKHGGYVVVGLDPHDRSQWRATALDENKTPKYHFVAKDHVGALELLPSMGVDVEGEPVKFIKGEDPNHA